MLRDERDYLLRLIAAVAATVARLRERLAGGAAPAEIVAEVRAAQGELLGKDAALLRAVDPASAARMLGRAERLTAWVDLLRIEADALRAAGHTDEAIRIEQRVHLLTAEVTPD